MSTTHYILFIGASASLADELNKLALRIASSKLIVPAMGKQAVGVNERSVKAAIESLYARMADDAPHAEAARLSIWAYGPPDVKALNQLWEAFGRSAWVEFVPIDLMHKNSPTRNHIEHRIRQVLPLLHQVSLAVYSGRKSSPLPLPLSNFRSAITADLKRFWYRNLDQVALSKEISRFFDRFRQLKHKSERSYEDDRKLLFQPAEDGVCHGQPHPTGSNNINFVAGRFRFGVSLFKGFHYEVSSSNHNTLQSELMDGTSKIRAMKPERRRYINIFPNDHLLPEK